MKLKRSLVVPLALLIYLIGISIYAYPERNPEITWSQYWMTIGITLVCIVILKFLLAKRDKMREKLKKK